MLNQIKKIKFILKGVNTYLNWSFLPKHQPQFSGHGVRPTRNVKDTARSCYTAWMRTLVAGNISMENIEHVAELGCGDSFGVGYAALLSGAEKFSAFDVVPTAKEDKELLEEMILLFKNKTPIPDDKEFPKAFPKLKCYDFPLGELTDETIERVRNTKIAYYVPWDKCPLPLVDLVVSYAAMEHVEDVERAYKRLGQITKLMAHVIDFKSHGTASTWYGHWDYSAFIWRLIRGRCVYFINRLDLMEQLALMKDFTIKHIECDVKNDDIAGVFVVAENMV